MRACLVLVPCLPPGARSLSLGRTLEGELKVVWGPAHLNGLKKVRGGKWMRIASARLAPTGAAKGDHAPARRHRRSLSSATQALVGGQIAGAAGFDWVCRRLA